MGILYAACLAYIFFNRKSIAFNSRSPKLLMIGIFVLCSDSILNTLIFSSSTGGSKNYRVKCILGIVATVIGLFGFLTSLTLRMYRVYKVFEIYKNYLDNQKKALGMKSSQDLEIVKMKRDERTMSAMSAHRRNY